MRTRPRQEEVRSCYIPVISAGLGFHGSMDGMNSLCRRAFQMPAVQWDPRTHL